jgi:hypothetical protein
MELYIHLALAFLAGMLVKIVDWMEDERRTREIYKVPLALLYGIIIGYLISRASFSTMFLAALFAQVFERKIDTLSHRLGFVVSILSLLYFGFPQLDFGVFAYFLVLAALDEVDLVGFWRPFTEYRLFLKLGALAMVAAGRWDYFFGIMCFDIGYEAVRSIAGKGQKSKTAGPRTV